MGPEQELRGGAEQGGALTRIHASNNMPDCLAVRLLLPSFFSSFLPLAVSLLSLPFYHR